MKLFPHYIQHNVMDCGPTCLRMVADFYGKRYSLEGLREKSFIIHEGVSMPGISKAAEKLGSPEHLRTSSLRNIIGSFSPRRITGSSSTLS